MEHVSDTDSYPPGGRDWICPHDSRTTEAHVQALLQEKIAHDTAAVRETFFGRLAAYGAIDHGFGWAIFGAEESDGAMATAAREVLLLSVVRDVNTYGAGRPLPLVRIITNEPIINETGITYVTEDVTVYEDNRAAYLLGAVHVMDEHHDQLPDLGTRMQSSQSPLFQVTGENHLALSTNAGPLTPYFKLTDVALPDDEAFPFGAPAGEHVEDTIYALGKASGILQSVVQIAPSHAYGWLA